MNIDLPTFSELDKQLILSYLTNHNVKTRRRKLSSNPPRFMISISHLMSPTPTAIGIAPSVHDATIAALESLRRRFNNSKP